MFHLPLIFKTNLLTFDNLLIHFLSDPVTYTGLPRSLGFSISRPLLDFYSYPSLCRLCSAGPHSCLTLQAHELQHSGSLSVGILQAGILE